MKRPGTLLQNSIFRKESGVAEELKMNRRKKRYIILLCIGLIVIILAIWTIWENTALVVSGFSVPSERLPAPFSGFRIAHVLDLHNRPEIVLVELRAANEK